MGLKDLKTDLKSLKYGYDRLGGGNSDQPYIQTNINRPGSNLIGNFDDGLVRGGAVGAAKASIVDTLRIGKFLTDFPKGPLFIVKQIGLQLSNPKLETKLLKTDNPTSGGGLLNNVGNFIVNVANKITNLVGPTRIYNLGINTIAQVPVNAFGQHVIRHGFSPVRNDNNSYFKVVQHNNEGENAPNNRLVQLKSILGNTNNISTYLGGPSSTYGIGTTIIQRRGNFIDINRDTTASTWATSKEVNNSSYVQSFVKNIIATTNLKIGKDLGLSKKTYSMLAGNLEIPIDPTGSAAYDKIASKKDKHGTNTTNQANSFANASRNINNFLGVSENSSSRYGLENFSVLSEVPATLYDKSPLQYYSNHSPIYHEVTYSADIGLSSASIDLSNKEININQNAVASILPTTSTSAKYTAIKRQVNSQYINQSYDNGNYILPTFTTENVSISRNASNYRYLEGKKVLFNFDRTNDRRLDDDTLALIFKPLDPFTGDPLSTLRFLGYLNEYTENYDSGWDPINYAGRAESFYVFTSFKRALNVSFSIPCYNKEELLNRHCALSELASSLAGKYQNNLLLGGIITRLKLGGYIDNQPGIITNLSFNPIQDSSWDLDEGLAFYLKVSFGFTVIHDFLPQYKHCGLMIAPPVVPDVVPVNPRPIIPPTPTPPVTVGGGGGIVSSSFTPFSRINMEMLRDDTQLKSNREKNIYGSLVEAQLSARDRQYGRFDFGGGDAGGAGGNGTGDNGFNQASVDKIMEKYNTRKQVINKDPKLLLSTQKYNF